MNALVTYVDTAIDQLERHPINNRAFLDPSEKHEELEWLNRFYDKFGMLKNIFIVQPTIDGIIKNYIISGELDVETLKSKGEKTVKAAVLNITDEKDIAQVMMELQNFRHCTIQEECKTYEVLYSIFSKGRGHRSDLVELATSPVDDATDATEKTKRRDNVYDLIGKMCRVSRNRVMYIIKVGRVNPWHFERIQKERYALYAAYLDCKDEEEGEEPIVPPAKAPIYDSTITEAPSYDNDSSTTQDSFTEEPYGDDIKDEDDIEDLQPKITNDINDTDPITINFKVNGDQLKDVDTTIEPEITIDATHPQFVTVTLTFTKIN